MACVSAVTVAGQQLVHVGFQPAQELGIGDRAVFDDLGQAGQQFALGQGVERGQVADHALGLVEAPRSCSCPRGWLMAVLPPTLESTWASSVVGTCTKGTPRM